MVVLRYAPGGIDLTQTTRFSVEQSGGGQFGRASFELEARVGWIIRDQQLEVSWETLRASGVELEGGLAIGAGEDVVPELVRHGRGAYRIDRKGERDELASDRLEANRGLQAALRELRAGDGSALARAQLLSWLPVALALPELPEQELTLGGRVTTEESQEIELEGDGLVMPATVTRTYALVRLDTGGVTPIAELSTEIVSSGRVETTDGPLGIEGVSRSTLLFDLDRGAPVALELSRTETFELGGKFGESTTVIETTWE